MEIFPSWPEFSLFSCPYQHRVCWGSYPGFLQALLHSNPSLRSITCRLQRCLFWVGLALCRSALTELLCDLYPRKVIYRCCVVPAGNNMLRSSTTQSTRCSRTAVSCAQPTWMPFGERRRLAARHLDARRCRRVRPPVIGLALCAARTGLARRSHRYFEPFRATPPLSGECGFSVIQTGFARKIAHSISLEALPQPMNCRSGGLGPCPAIIHETRQS